MIFASSEGERMWDWEGYWEASRGVGTTFLSLWSSMVPSEKSGPRALSTDPGHSFPEPSGSRMRTG